MRVLAAVVTAMLTTAHVSTPQLLHLRVSNGSTPFAGDGPLVTTVSPNGDGFRDAAHVQFDLTAPATVELDVLRTDSVAVDPEDPASLVVKRFAPRKFKAGAHTMTWRPAPSTPPRTYSLQLVVTGADGTSHTYAPAQPNHPRVAPTVRVQGIEAGFPRASYAPGDDAVLHVSTDARALRFQVFAYGGGAFPTDRDLKTSGQAMTAPAYVDWSGHRDAPADIHVVRPGSWPSGLYFLRISSTDGRVGYAPFIVRPKTLGVHRVAIVLSTQTWQAYNFEDANADGWGDSWYVNGRNRVVDLTRPYLDFGIPYRFNDWDLTFLTWLQETGRKVDYLSDRDLEGLSGDRLASLYDLVVFPGHEEYVTAHQRATIARYRDLGGNLAFLAANNLFWHVRITGNGMRKAGMWRDQGKSEGSVTGAPYVGSNHGQVEAPFVVAGATTAPWFFAGTGLQDGSAFGRYGIEIDASGATSPPGTIVLARIPDLLGPGKSAEMTYYETPAGAKVFDAGALDFAASATERPVSQLLDNLWARLSKP